MTWPPQYADLWACHSQVVVIGHDWEANWHRDCYCTIRADFSLAQVSLALAFHRSRSRLRSTSLSLKIQISVIGNSSLRPIARSFYGAGCPSFGMLSSYR